MQTPPGRNAIVCEVKSEPEQSPFRQFVEAVLAFSDDPDPVNLSRYLAASRALEDDGRSRVSRLPTRRAHRTATHVNDAAA